MAMDTASTTNSIGAPKTINRIPIPTSISRSTTPSKNAPQALVLEVLTATMPSKLSTNPTIRTVRLARKKF